MKFLKTVLLVSAIFTGAAVQAADIPNRETLKLEVKCEFYRRYLGANGEVKTENLTPASVLPQPVEIGDTSGPGGSLPTTNLTYTVATPDGDIEVRVGAEAVDFFKQIVDLTLFQSLRITSKEVGIVTPMAKGPHYKYADPNATFEHQNIISFTVGTTAKGYAVNEYHSSCKIGKVGETGSAGGTPPVIKP